MTVDLACFLYLPNHFVDDSFVRTCPGQRESYVCYSPPRCSSDRIRDSDQVVGIGNSDRLCRALCFVALLTVVGAQTYRPNLCQTRRLVYSLPLLRHVYNLEAVRRPIY